MLQNCLYHINDFIVVPHAKAKRNYVKSLQYFCSVSIARHACISPKDIPPTLFPCLLGYAIINGFALYINDIKHGQFDGIGHILAFWPQESLILKDFFPIELPPWIFHKEVTFKNRIFIFKKFIFEFAKYLMTTFLSDRRPYYILKHLDISGLGCIREMMFCPENLMTLLQHCLAFQTKHSRSVTMDVNVVNNSVEDLIRIYELNRLSDNNLKINISGILFESASPSKIIKILSHRVEKPKFLHVSLCQITCELTDEITQKTFTGLQGLELMYPASFSDVSNFEYLSNFGNLTQLSLAGMTLNGKLNMLDNLKSNLQYLSLIGCHLRYTDLLHLRRHLPSLLHLEIGENKLGEEEIQVLVELSKSLNQLLILDLENCKLDVLSHSQLNLLIGTLVAQCPSLRMLNLLYNDFTLRNIRENIILLTKKKSLLQLYLTVPSEVYLNDDYGDTDQTIQNLRTLFENASAKENSSLNVSWEEDSTFSSWFYCSFSNNSLYRDFG